MKISLKNLNLKEVEKLTREQLKDVFGGVVQPTTGGGCAVACRTEGSSCITTDCKPGTCGWYMGFFGCK
ncbi:hypothetical protein [Sphingobacterium griseoflavum]|uniref:Natural product n=1 Tax=Sphingobacterium griseoflavum TaxID=1474952 RepID=A0ABQ3HVZ6_9SPHI|nr:hypothetical protein [Sphingobacterium griseoflavum]GHE31829.1 hypothetical protein GCM10017764_13720 [Sphingobacterium griseoflavum]